MEDKEIFEKLEKILMDPDSDWIGITPKTKITPGTNLRKDLGFDSLEEYEFVYLIEGEFEISIPDYIAVELETPKAYVDYIQKCLKEK
jgi:acyl carrier protein